MWTQSLKNKNQKCNHDNFHCYHTFRSAAAAAQPFRADPGRSALQDESHQEPPQEQQCEKHNPGSLSMSAPDSFLLGMNAMRLPFTIHSWRAFPSTGALSRKACSVPASSLPQAAVSHQLLLSLWRCHGQGHPSPLSPSHCWFQPQSWTSPSCCPQGLGGTLDTAFGIPRGGHQAQYLNCKDKRESIRGSFIRGDKRLVDGLINTKPSQGQNSCLSHGSNTET